METESETKRPAEAGEDVLLVRKYQTLETALEAVHAAEKLELFYCLSALKEGEYELEIWQDGVEEEVEDGSPDAAGE